MVTYMNSTTKITVTTNTGESFQERFVPASMGSCAKLQSRLAARFGLARGMDLRIWEVTHEGLGAIMTGPEGLIVTITPNSI